MLPTGNIVHFIIANFHELWCVTFIISIPLFDSICTAWILFSNTFSIVENDLLYKAFLVSTASTPLCPVFGHDQSYFLSMNYASSVLQCVGIVLSNSATD